jgi:hypothetical protein
MGRRNKKLSLKVVTQWGEGWRGEVTRMFLDIISRFSQNDLVTYESFHCHFTHDIKISRHCYSFISYYSLDLYILITFFSSYFPF